MIKRYFAVIVASMSVSSTYAATVDFPVGQKNGSFNCTVSDPTAIVYIDTNGVDANGFCAGNPYVTKDGHIQAMPASELNQVYFEIKKLATRKGSVEVTVSSGELTCASGHGNKSNAFGNGKFCFSK